ncbi:hypothetical protein GNQ08_24730 [Paenibacillus macerans]|uniref:Metal-dependent hydrolase n=2 Tax=Paenibacillus macerans TaxID=44252 RepID=A0A6N8F4J4_PAEMA|nr:metal-dependent hydrolase [Paenibacillus macerans]MUG25571.1 hypothetical protein [Paenibacillus macerans]UMV49512.1 metal-dependent hydrolase [Paenibacillus macerans]GBK69863.1 hypothetical protein PbJCM17693_35710 [Paenibacillus macerans]
MNMNKQGHVALAVTAGSAALLMMPSLAVQTDAGIAAALVAAAGVGGVFPDFDHKTSTVSNRIQFPLRYRRLFRTLSGFLGALGVGLVAYRQFGHVPEPLEEWVKSGPLWLGAAILFWLLARLRSLVLIGIGALLLAGYAMYDLHWIAAFAGFAFLILPLVKHRGVIHTPEFAAVLSIGLLNFSAQQPEIINMAAIGFVIGWWAHLAGDIFGDEGIHFLLLPKLKIALRLFKNGGPAERWISRTCWGGSLLIWGAMLLQTQILLK